VHGEWFRYVTQAGVASADEPKVSFWKCPYHNGRACLEMIERLERIREHL
jgi:cellobiose epimerase